ncbi:metabotropic glutamate receptor 2-like [Lineus longissimus]|uniref:metabotropic glutamate receptor 2-like n=1 Tax=Lineus longissimus TaxID=88925 RepID=UPI00315DEBA9
MALEYAFTWIALLSCVLCQKLGNYTGDILLGALFPIHTRNDLTGSCGVIQGQDGIRSMEAMFYTLDEINNKPGFLPFKLGAITVDSCDDPAQALGQSVNMVKYLVSRSTEGKPSYQCADGSNPERSATSAELTKIVGIVGGASSEVSIQVASFLRLFQIPQVSYLSTSPDLSNSEKFGYFLRTVPSDVNQALAIIRILKHFGWEYVSIVYDDTNYGLKGSGALETFADAFGICIATRVKVDSSLRGDSDEAMAHYIGVMRQLMQKNHARVVIVYSDYPQAKMLFRAAKQLNVVGMFTWIGSDGWSGRLAAVSGVEDVVDGAITVQPRAVEIPGFDRHFQSLDPFTHIENPWFQEYWQAAYNCSFTNPLELCTGIENTNGTDDYSHKNHSQLQYVRDAVYAFAYALRAIHRDVCGPMSNTLCPAMAPEKIKGDTLLHYLKMINFTDTAGNEFVFVNGIDGPPYYRILSFGKNKVGEFEWRDIGKFNGNITSQAGFDITEQLELFPEFLHLSQTFPPSVCSEPCSQDQAVKVIESDHCCWVCVNCTDYQYKPTEDTCVDCTEGFLPNYNRSQCESIPEEMMPVINPLTIVAVVLSLLGIVATIVMVFIFIKYNNTPVVKASGRESSHVLLAGIFLSYSVTFVFLATPNVVVCVLTRVLLGAAYTICYAAILTKCNRIARIFNPALKTAKKARFISPRSQLLIITMLCIIEVIILTVWMVVDHPGTAYIYPTRYQKVLVCQGAQGFSFLIALVYPFVLLIISTVYAIMTRKTPDGFNETRTLAFTNYTNCIIWLAFIPIFFTSNSNIIRMVTLSIATTISGTVAITCLFIPKIHVVLFRPEKNTKEAVMNRTRSKSTMDGDLGSKVLGDRSRSSSVGLQNSSGSKVASTLDVSQVTFVGPADKSSSPRHSKTLGIAVELGGKYLSVPSSNSCCAFQTENSIAMKDMNLAKRGSTVSN